MRERREAATALTLTPAQQRKLQRAAHLAAAIALFAYLYGPIGEQLADVIRWIVFPLLSVTGVAMWQAPRIRRLRTAAGRTRDVAQVTTPGRAGHGRRKLR